MQQFSGRAAAPGLAQGSVVWFAETACGKTPQGTPAQELEKFRLAREDCTRRQAQLYQAAREQAGEEAAAIFELHGMLLQEDLLPL